MSNTESLIENDDGVLITRPFSSYTSSNASYTLSASKQMRKVSTTPSNEFTVIEYEDVGYDPYEYLDLP